ncbi:MAG: alpha/beta hydrolase [Planctomycetota bacterium]|nr:alpha/beta hydrolase [Planctomycetota bacterium]
MKFRYAMILSVVVCGTIAFYSSVSEADQSSATTQKDKIKKTTAQDDDRPDGYLKNVIELQYEEKGVIMDPRAAAFVSMAEQGPPIQTLTPHQAWENLNKLQAGYQVPSNITLTEKVLPTGPTGSTKVQIYMNKGVKKPAPGIVYMHGGGFVMGSSTTHKRLMCELATCSDRIIVFVDYTNAPEGKYPTAHKQCYAVLQYVYDHPSEFGIDPTKIVVAGDSVGGAMAATCSLLAIEQGGPQIQAQVLFYPAVNLDANAIDYGVLKDGPWLSKANLYWAWSQYFTPKDNLKSIYISPVYATVEQLEGQPQTMVITDDCGPLHGSGEQYAKNLIAAGVDVTAMRFFGITHDFMMLNALKDTPAAKGALAAACHYLRTLN